MKTTHCYTQTTPFNLGPIGPINVQILFYLIITNFFKNFHNMIEIMLWKFFWTYQKNDAIENHTMENHVRRGLTVIYLQENPNFWFFLCIEYGKFFQTINLTTDSEFLKSEQVVRHCNFYVKTKDTLGTSALEYLHNLQEIYFLL